MTMDKTLIASACLMAIFLIKCSESKYTGERSCNAEQFYCSKSKDEKCAQQCGDKQFYCPRSDECVPSDYKCDGKTDCQWWEDEEDCDLRNYKVGGKSCPPSFKEVTDEVECRSAAKILNSRDWKASGKPGCIFVENKSEVVVNPNSFIYNAYRWKRICTPVKKARNIQELYFRCSPAGNEYINANLRCDGHNDCENGEDEEDRCVCTKGTKFCNGECIDSTQFDCDYGKKIVRIAGKYKEGKNNINICPAGYVKISDESACTEAANLLKKSYQMKTEESDMPSGCYVDRKFSDDRVYFNVHSAGAGNERCRPLCVKE